MVDNGLMVFVGTVGKVHADDIEASLAELVDSLNGVCLRTNCADDRGSAVVLGGVEIGVQLGEPSDLGCAGG